MQTEKADCWGCTDECNNDEEKDIAVREYDDGVLDQRGSKPKTATSAGA